MKTKLTRHQWELTHQPQIEIFKNTLMPERASGTYNPIVYRNIFKLNELFRSLQVHVPGWESDPLWKVYFLPHQQKIGLDDSHPHGGPIAYFKCLPYANLLGAEFALRDSEEGPTAVLQKIAQKFPRDETPLLRMWRIWQKKGPSALSRYPLRICAPIQTRKGWSLLRSTDSKVMAARFHEHKTYEIPGCCIRRELHNQEAFSLTLPIDVANSRVLAKFQEFCNWPGTLSELMHNPSLYEVVLRGHYEPGNPINGNAGKETKTSRSIPTK